jgi:branched-chain amino acid transport system substrate-binding protein
MIDVNVVRRLLAFASAVVLGALPVGGRAAAEPYDFDVILPLSGPGAFTAASQQKALLALEDVVNRDGGIAGRPVHFTFLDDQSNPQVSLQLANEAIAKKPAVVFGSSLGALCKAMIPVFASGPVEYCFSPVISPAPGGYVFSAGVSGADLIVATMRYMRLRGWKRFATLNTTDASGQIADAEIANTLKLPENKELVLVASEHFNQTDTSASAQITKIKAAGPQAIIVWSPGTPFGTALHAIQDVGLDVPVFTTSANMIVAQIKSYGAFLPKDLYFQGTRYIAGVSDAHAGRALQTFSTAMKANGIPQDFQAGIAWDPAMIVIDALRKLGPNASSADLHAYIEKLGAYPGITGTYDFRDGNQRGLTVNDLLIMRWDGEKSDFAAVSKLGGGL